jgi:FkbM family methyltransferase
MKMRFQSYVGAVARRFGLSKKSMSQYPKILTVHDIPPFNCRFEVTNSIETSRVEGGAREAEFTSMIVSELKVADVLYDIGACIGMVTIHAAKAVGCKVVAFEPDYCYRSRLMANLTLNGLDNVKVIEWAVSDTKGEVSLFTDGVEGNAPSLRKVGDRGQVTVSTDTIDNALTRNEIPYPDVIKMDIEGAEILALRGMNKLLASVSAPRIIFIEIHPEFLPEFGSSTKEVIEILRSFQYKQDYRAQRHNQIHYIYRKIYA